MKTQLSLIALLGLLASCSVTPTAPDPFLTQAIEPEAAPLASDVSAEFAAAYLPSLAGSVQSVRQTVAKDSLHQEIVYSNQTTLEGENLLTVDVGQPDKGTMLRPPSEAQIRREMRAAFTGVNLTMSPIMGENQSGVYGYATAAYGSQGACIYAWQRVKSVNPADSSGFARLSRVHLAASVRLRFCHPGIGEGQIHTVMDGLTVKEINSQTINMLRFASGSAMKAAPPAVVTQKVAVATPRKKAVRKAEVEDDDWRKEAVVPAPAATDTAGQPVVIHNAAAVPLPDEGATASVTVTVPVADAQADAAAKPVRIPEAAAVPLPE